MDGTFEMMSVYVSNMLGIVLGITILTGNLWRMRKMTRENLALTIMLLSAMLSCIIDPIAFYADGRAGVVYRAVIYISNSWLYAANMVTAYYWVEFLSRHLSCPISRTHRLILRGITLFGLTLLVLNLIVPVAFSVDDHNVYSRQAGYWLYVVADLGFILDSLFIYAAARRRGGMLKFFPVWVYMIPIIIGMFFQSLYYGTSVVWACVMIAVAGVMSSLQNELIFRDRLTGLYNRYYLDDLKYDITHNRSTRFTGMMLDLNGFKQINDRYGHTEGDEALCTMARLLEQAVGRLGTVVRYAGDEFIVVLNTQDSVTVAECEAAIRKSINAWNAARQKEYKLSVSIGTSYFELSERGVDQLMNDIDRRMYEDKARYYTASAEHDRRRR